MHAAFRSPGLFLLPLLHYSLSLIRGKLDQAAQVAHISWVQPRVLEMEQLKVLRGKLGNWLDRVKDTETFVETENKSGGSASGTDKTIGGPGVAVGSTA